MRKLISIFKALCLFFSVISLSSGVLAVYCGNVNQSITLNQSLTVNGTCFTVNVSNVVIDGNGSFITGNNTNSYGINVTGFNNVTIRNFAGIRNFTTGIYAGNANFTMVNNNTVIAANISSGNGIYLYGANYSNITRNNISTSGTNGYGILFSSVNGDMVFDNILLTRGDGANAVDSVGAGTYNNTFSNNSITTTGAGSSGLNIGQTSQYVLLNYINLTGASKGFYLAGSGHLISGNTIYSADSGAYFNGADDCIITQNRFTLTGSGSMGVETFISSSTAANNNSVTFNNFTLTGTNSAGFMLSRTANSTFANNSINTANGNSIVLNSANNSGNIFINNTLINTNTSYYSLNISADGVNYTTFIDMSIGRYTITGSPYYTIFRKAGLGEINFTQAISGSGANLSSDIFIAYNNASVNSSNSGLNKSAIITFYGMLTNMVLPKIKRDRVTCNATSIPSCFNLTNFNAGTVIFNVSGWSGYYLEDEGGGPGEPDIVNTLQCMIVQNNTCLAGMVKVIGIQNDSRGFNNAHVQNSSLNTYNNSLCCNSTNASITLLSSCPGNVSVLKMFDTSNAHAEIGTNSNYNFSACLGSNWKRVACNYPTPACSAGYQCLLSMAGSEGSNITNAHVAECTNYSQKVCCALVNHPPTQPVLNYPVTGNYTVLERRPNFNWTNATDYDGDPISYTINASCGTTSCRCSAVYLSGIYASNYTPASNLCVDVVYNWTVTACDIYNACNMSAQSNFTIASITDFVLIVNASSFGNMSNGESRQTNASIQALVGRNNGNVLMNATINASGLFSAVSMNTTNYNYNVSDNESSSILPACSQIAFTPLALGQKNLFCNLSYVDTADEVKININVTVPMNESPGVKTSNIAITISGE
jgi:hypothetical protein